MSLLAAITPLLIVLGGLVGAGIGCLFVTVVRATPPSVQKDRELQIAKETARRTFEETIKTLFADDAEPGSPH